jgi:hypothetical protein
MFLSEVLQTLIGKADAELIKGVGPARHVLGAGKIKETNEYVEVIAADRWT